MNKIIKEDIEKTVKNLKKFEEKLTNSTILISGGAGFIGSWFCDVALALGAKKIICVDNLSSGSIKNIKHLLASPKFEFIKKDICKFTTKEKLDYVVHMASIATPGIYMKYPVETLDTNLFGTKKMLEFAQKNKAKGFLITSTSEVYGNPADIDIPTEENYYGYVNSYGARSMYDEGKRGAEAYCYSFGQKFPQMPIRIVRIFNTYGPRLDIESTSQYGRALVKFIWQALNNKPITIYSDGRQTRSFCYITDQLRGLFTLLLTPGIDHQAINIGNGKEYSILALAKKIIKITDSKSKILHDSPPNYNLSDDPRRRCPNLAKAKKLISYETKISLDEGLKRTSLWLKETL